MKETGKMIKRKEEEFMHMLMAMSTMETGEMVFKSPLFMLPFLLLQMLPFLLLQMLAFLLLQMLSFLLLQMLAFLLLQILRYDKSQPHHKLKNDMSSVSVVSTLVNLKLCCYVKIR